jgi:hypothetical protein
MKSPRDAKLQAFGLGGAAAALVLTVLLAGCGGGGEPAASAAPTTVFGRQARELALGIAAVRNRGTVSVATTVLGQDGAGAKDLDVAVAAGSGAWMDSKACGSGRYCSDVDVSGPQRSLRVRVTRSTGGVSTVDVTLPPDPRPALATKLVRAAATAIRGLHSLIINEHLSSGPPYEPLVTQFSYVAPDRLAYSTSRAGDAVVVGGRRGDRRTGKQRWLAAPQDPLQLPAPDWRRALDASILGSGRRGGRPVWLVSFYDPSVPAWFEVELDKRTSLPLHLRMTAAAHFMTHTFHAFNAPLSIMPPV